MRDTIHDASREATIKRLAACEAIRAKILAEGKTSDEAHEAAKEHWNNWARAILERRRLLVDAGRWAERKLFDSNSSLLLMKRRETTVAGDTASTELPTWVVRYGTIETLDWTRDARTNFGGCQFQLVGSDGKPEADRVALPEKIQVHNTGLNFDGFIFPGNVSFKDAVFDCIASFNDAEFRDEVTFRNARFKQGARFNSAEFSKEVSFARILFHRSATFLRTKFKGTSSFNQTIFRRDSLFKECIFSGEAWFSDARFKGSATFVSTVFAKGFFFKTKFRARADFSLTTFREAAWFDSASFQQEADFSAALAERAFSLAHTSFLQVPSFIQTHFEETPRLDSLVVYPLRISYLRHIAAMLGFQKALTFPTSSQSVAEMPARYRALRKLAIEGRDHERQQDFLAQEILLARFATEREAFCPELYRQRLRIGATRRWIGLGYQVFSDFGRSIIRPATAWTVTMMLAAMIFLAENQMISAHLRSLDTGRGSAAATTGSPVPRALHFPCITSQIVERKKNSRIVEPDPSATTSSPIFTGLTSTMARNTDALYEAFLLAWHNSLVVLNAGQDSEFRSYGCLYGIERYGDNPVPFIPPMVAFISITQKALSAIFIFLFGLGLRNMMRMQ